MNNDSGFLLLYSDNEDFDSTIDDCVGHIPKLTRRFCRVDSLSRLGLETFVSLNRWIALEKFDAALLLGWGTKQFL